MCLTNLFILAGEHSGDVYGGRLLEALKTIDPTVTAYGVGGPLMRDQGFDCIMRMEDFQVMGFAEIVRKFPKIWKQFYALRDLILERKPDVTILIDYPGFNLRLAKALRKKGYKGKIVHYVCPTVWAWGKGRIKTLVNTLDLLLTIFPFEPSIFAKTPLQTQFVGHPLVEALNTHKYDTEWKQKVGLKCPTSNVLALFPGSRAGEVTRLLKRQFEAAIKLRTDDPSLQIAVSCADERVEALIRSIAAECNLNVGSDVVLVPRQYSYDLMKDCRSAIAKSGTVNLEIALHEKPCVVVYEISVINYLIMWYIIRLNLEHYSIVNILSNKRIYPELVTETFSSQQLYDALAPLHREGAERTECLIGCQQTRESLHTNQDAAPSHRAAQAIAKLCE